jgi:FAD synthase
LESPGFGLLFRRAPLDLKYCNCAPTKLLHRPTVNNVKARLEVHLLDFDGECYGRQVTVWFLQKIRDEQKFDSKEQLKQQIAQDIAQAKQWLTQ